MKYLSELINILSKKQLQKNELLEVGHLEQKENLFSKFYYNLKDRKLKSDQDAALLLYGSKANNAKYRKLKSRFNKKLINNILLLDINFFKLPKSYLAEVQIKRDLGLASLFKAIGAKENARRFAKKSLNRAETYHFHQSILSACVILADLYTENHAYKESEHINAKHKEALKGLKYEFDLLEENRTLNQILKYKYPQLDQNLIFAEKQELEEKNISCSPKAIKLICLNKTIKHLLLGEFEAAGETCAKYFKNHPFHEHTREDLFRFVFFEFSSKCKTSSTNQVQSYLKTLFDNSNFVYQEQEYLYLSFISHLIDQNNSEIAIKVYNKLIEVIEQTRKKQISTKVEIYYYFLQYFRLKENILIPIKSVSKLNQINSLEDFTSIRVRTKDINRVYQLQILLLELIGIKNRFKRIEKIEEIRKLQNSETHKVPKRAQLVIKILTHWERQDFTRLPTLVHKDFIILCESNFLNSQNLDTFEPVNYGSILKLIFKSHSISIPEFTQAQF